MSRMNVEAGVFSIAILCDAVPELGMGHLARCSNLCRALQEAGGKVAFMLLNGGRTEFVRLPGTLIHVLNTPPKDGHSAAEEFLDAIPTNTELVVVDNYRLGSDFYEVLRNGRPGLPVIVYDDFGEKASLPVLGVINGGLSALSLPYPGRFSPFSAVGLEYAALPERCLAVQPKAAWNEKVSRVLLVMGGSDPERQTLRLARLLDAMDLDLFVDVVLGPMYGEAEPELGGLGSQFSIHFAPENFFELAARCDLAIMGGGTTCMEFLYLGVPMAVLSLAGNQDMMTSCLDSLGVGRALGRFDQISDSALIKALQMVLSEPEELADRARRGQGMVDGKGAHRLADRLLEAAALFSGRGFALAEVADEYQAASCNQANHEKALWGSADGMRNRFRLALEMLGHGKIPSWLDVGCGPGDFLHEAEPVLNPETFTGLDLCAETLALARVASTDMAGRRFLAGDFMDSLDGENFSLVTALGVLHKCGHSLNAAIERLAALTAPGGRVLVTTKNLDWARFDAPDFKPYAGHAWFRADQVTAAMKACGLTDIEVRGFEPRTGRWVPLEQAHSMMILATRKDAA